jgi:uncharacterized protein YjbI with pentapeptide repeats
MSIKFDRISPPIPTSKIRTHYTPDKFIVTFKDVNLEKCIFACCDLTNLIFENCNMNACDFAPRVFQNGETVNTTLLSVADPKYTTKFTNTSIKGCNFTQVNGFTNFDFRTIKDSDLTAVIFTGVELQGSDFTDCKITGSIFSYATLDACNFQNVREFQNADFTEIVGVPDNIPVGLNINGVILASTR